jgi:hypothetical protein
VTKSLLLKASPRKYPLLLANHPGTPLNSFIVHYRYQLAVINQGILNPQCTNLVPNESICLGYQGEDCTTVYSAFLP